MVAPETQPQPSWRFAGTFRPYQQRILERFDGLKQDHRIHIVAAPGSGKTILGLELICCLGQPALILAPTITIRDQWHRALTAFMDQLGRRKAVLNTIALTATPPYDSTPASGSATSSYAALSTRRSSPRNSPASWGCSSSSITPTSSALARRCSPLCGLTTC